MTDRKEEPVLQELSSEQLQQVSGGNQSQIVIEKLAHEIRDDLIEYVGDTLNDALNIGKEPLIADSSAIGYVPPAW